MPSIFNEQKTLRFDFPEGWEVTKYDEWDFYRVEYQSCINRIFGYGPKALDVLAFDIDGSELWLIEIKDFRKRMCIIENDGTTNREDVLKSRTRQKKEKNQLWKKQIQIDAIDLSKKIINSLGGLSLAKFKAANKEKTFANSALMKTKLRLCFHVEQPEVKKAIHKGPINPINYKRELIRHLKRYLECVDPYITVTDSVAFEQPDSFEKLGWKVERLNNSISEDNLGGLPCL